MSVILRIVRTIQVSNNRGVIIKREQLVNHIQTECAESIKELYHFEPSTAIVHPQYQGCQNLIFFFRREGEEYVFRVSFREDRDYGQIAAEVHFVQYLSQQGVSVCPAVPSVRGNLVERLSFQDHQMSCVVFQRGKGEQLHTQGYRYREGAPLEEYFRNTGSILGQMHKAAVSYVPPLNLPKRLDWIHNFKTRLFSRYLPEDQTILSEKFHALMDSSESLPRESGSYGIIHSDFSELNCTIDYSNGKITAFDFDDCMYHWFMYDLANAWLHGMGWTKWEPDAGKRREFMDRYFDTVMEGYSRWHTVSDDWMNKLPYFIKLNEMEWIVDGFRDMIVNDEPVKIDRELGFKIHCMEQDIPYSGFFNSVYSHEYPFSLPAD